MSFVMLTESQLAPPSPPTDIRADDDDTPDRGSLANRAMGPENNNLLSQKTNTIGRLYEILSSRSDVDHPICKECTEILMDGLQQRLGHVTKERDLYVDFLRQANSDIPTDEEVQQAQDELAITHEEQRKALEELEGLEREKARMDEEIIEFDAKCRSLDEDEETFWRDRSALGTTLHSFQNDRDRLIARLDHDSKQLDFLQRTNVYNDTFCIGHDGFFGTINGLRLGRLPNLPVEWAEINAAWGQTCLLLAIVAEKFKFSFQGYRLNPMGSTSTIEKVEYAQSPATNEASNAQKPRTTSLELYCTGELPLGLGFLHRRFDSAMVAFLECLRQVGEFVEHSSVRGASDNFVSGLKMPYEIRKDKIGDASIKSGGFNQEEAWTKACKYTLTCCKYLLAHASNISNSYRKDA